MSEYYAVTQLVMRNEEAVAGDEYYVPRKAALHNIIGTVATHNTNS